MKSNWLVLSLLFLSLYTYTYGLENMFQTAQKTVNSIKAYFVAQRKHYTKKCIMSRARAYMDPTIAAYKNFEDIKKAFRSKEKELLSTMQHAFNIPQHEMDQFDQTIAELKEDAQNNRYVVPIGEVMHDATINIELMEKIHGILKNHGINPHTINIIADQEFFTTYSTLAAYTRDPYADTEWCGITRWKKGDSFFGVNLKVINQLTNSNIILYHEVVHLQEVHITQRLLVERLIMKYNPTFTLSYVESQPAFIAWFRFHELMGYIFPVLHFPDLLLPELFAFCTEGCTPLKTFVSLLMFAQWNQSPAMFAYPAIEELLPWYLKIEEIYKNQRKK